MGCAGGVRPSPRAFSIEELTAVDENTRRQVTWVIVIGLVVVLVIVGGHRRGALDRAVGKLARGTPAERVAVVRGLINSDKLADTVEDQPRWVQDRAVAAACQVGTPQAWEQLAVIMPLLDKPVADEAKAYLITQGEQAIGPMAQILYHKDVQVRAVAPGVLAKIGPPAVPTLLGMLGVYDDDARAGALGALAGIGEPAVEPLIEVLKKTGPGPDQLAAEFVRAQDTAYGALNAMKVTSVSTVMAELLAYGEPKARETGARLVGDIIDQTAKFYKHPAVVEPIQLVIPIPVADAQTAVAPLINRVRHDVDWRVRRQAALSLGRLLTAGNRPEVIAALVDHLGDRRVEVKAACVTSLGQIRAVQVAPILVSVLLDDRGGAVTELQGALQRLGISAIGALSPALNSTNTESRRLATGIVAGIGGRQAVAVLAARLHDSNEVIRRLAAETLGDMSADTLVPTATPEVVSSLVAALDDADWHVYHAVREALAEVGAPAVTPLIKKLAAPDVRSRYMAQQALAEIGGDAVGQLLGSLRDERGEIRHWAAVTLGKIGPNVIGPTTRLLKDLAESSQARTAAARALGYTGSPAATEALKEAADAPEPVVRLAILKGINDLRDADGTETLVAGLQDSDMGVRDVAAALLEQWQLGEVTDLLNKVLAEEDENARRRAAIILAYHSSPEANRLLFEVMGSAAKPAEAGTVVQVLTATIEDAEEGREMRRAAVKNLGAVGTPASVGVLETMVTPESEFIAEAAGSVAQIGLRSVQGTRARDRKELGRSAELLIKVFKETHDERLRGEVARALATMQELPVAELLQGLRTYPDQLKPWVAGILAAIGEPAAEPTSSARDGSDDREQKLWCVAVLQAIGDTQVTLFIAYLPEDELPDAVRRAEVLAMKERISGHE